MEDEPSTPRAWGPEPEPPPPDASVAEPPTPRAPSRWPGRVVVALTVAALLGAGLCLLGARRADDRTATARRATAHLVTSRHRVQAATERVSHTADGPIGVAEKVSSSVSRILGTTGPVIDAANTAQDRLGNAVDVANGGSPGAARALYAGTVADAIRGLQALLTDAQNALTTARTAAFELAAQAQ